MIPSGIIYTTTTHRSLYLTSFKIVICYCSCCSRVCETEGGAQKLIHTYIDLLQPAWGDWVATTPWGHSVTTTLTHLPTATGRLPAHRFAIPLAALHHTLTLLLPTTTMDIPTLAGLATPPMFIWAIVLPFKLHRLHHNIISLVGTGERSLYLLFPFMNLCFWNNWNNIWFQCPKQIQGHLAPGSKQRVVYIYIYRDLFHLQCNFAWN